MNAEHRCPDCGLVYGCAMVECRSDFELRCTPCDKARQAHYVGLMKAAAAYAEHVRQTEQENTRGAAPR